MMKELGLSSVHIKWLEGHRYHDDEEEEEEQALAMG